MASSQKYDHLHIFAELDDPERQALITELVRKVPPLKQVSRHGFWRLWFQDIPQLKRNIQSEVKRQEGIGFQSAYPSFQTPESIYLGIGSHDDSGMRNPISLKKLPPQTTQYVTASEQATLDRDRNQCILTQRHHNSSHPAYIFPAHIHRRMSPDWLCEWGTYEVEFGKERVRRWQDAIQTSATLDTAPGSENLRNHWFNDTDQPQNMITLDKEVQRYWEDDLCVFRPISLNEDKTSMELAFHWLPAPIEGKPLWQMDSLFLRHHPYPKRRMGYDDSPGNGIHLYDAEGKSICSGHIFTITTDDPVHRPLPSMDLLDLQWMVKRSSRFCGYLSMWTGKAKRMREDSDLYYAFRGTRWSLRARAWLYEDEPENENVHIDDQDYDDSESELELVENYGDPYYPRSNDEEFSEDEDGHGKTSINISINLQSGNNKPNKNTVLEDEVNFELERVQGTGSAKRWT